MPQSMGPMGPDSGPLPVCAIASTINTVTVLGSQPRKNEPNLWRFFGYQLHYIGALYNSQYSQFFFGQKNIQVPAHTKNITAEYLQETMNFTIKYRVFRLKFSHHPILCQISGSPDPNCCFCWGKKTIVTTTGLFKFCVSFDLPNSAILFVGKNGP